MNSLSLRKKSSTSQHDKNMWACESVQLPTNDFEREIWGEAGVPDCDAKTFTQAAATLPAESNEEKSLENSFDDRHVITATQAMTPTKEPPEVQEDGREKIRLTNFCWKRRSGMGKFSMIHPWERRRLVLVGTKIYYFSLTEEEEEAFQNEEMESSASATNDSEALESTNVEITPLPAWLEQAVAQAENVSSYSTKEAVRPRGVIDLSQEGAVVEASEGNMMTCPTPYEIDVKITGDLNWKLCFESQSIQIEWLAALADVIQSSSSADNKEHNFEPGDHVIRWEMLPIVYPIQIHGIVLEAGRNCVIIADFGLTSYGKSTTTTTTPAPTNDTEESKEGNNNKEKEESHDFVMAAWHKIKPKQEKQRLNVIALTDPREIRKWSKINYGRNLFSTKKGNKFTSWLSHKSSSNVPEAGSQHASNEGDAERELEEAMQYINSYGETKTETEMENETTSDEPPFRGWKPVDENGTKMRGLRDPEWFKDKNEEASDEASDSELTRPSVFTLEGDADESSDEPSKLPKSDPTKIVLARTNFLLEFGEEVLPPYHVFHSNSECIAVWCKTGRWSTLQTAVFLHSTAIGNAKSATAITLGVAAAHVVLVPALAVGGLAMVTAPWLILKKSKEKWEEATMKLTDLFWAWAEPEVFVEAIEHWSGLCPPPTQPE